MKKGPRSAAQRLPKERTVMKVAQHLQFNIRRRTLLGGAAASAFSLAAPNVTRAQTGPDIPIGVLLPFTGSQGAYGGDMRKAAELPTAMINDAGGILGG